MQLKTQCNLLHFTCVPTDVTLMSDMLPTPHAERTEVQKLKKNLPSWSTLKIFISSSKVDKTMMFAPKCKICDLIIITHQKLGGGRGRWGEIMKNM